LSELTPQQITEKHLTGVKGLFIKEVDPNGLAADVRPNEIIPGEVVTRINRVPVATLADFQRVVDSLKAGDAIVSIFALRTSADQPRGAANRTVHLSVRQATGVRVRDRKARSSGPRLLIPSTHPWFKQKKHWQRKQRRGKRGSIKRAQQRLSKFYWRPLGVQPQRRVD